MTSRDEGPVESSIATGFRVLMLAVAVLAVAWAGSNWQRVPPDAQAVLLRFGQVVGVRGAGLVLSWPRPIGRVALLPGPQRLLVAQTVTTASPAGLVDNYAAANASQLPPGAGVYLTGDGGVVLLSAGISYQVSDGAQYFLAETHVVPALLRVFEASAVQVLGRRALEDVMIAEPVRAGADPERTARAAAQREALRGDLQAEMNRRLEPLALGVRVARIDPDVSLPPQAKLAYDQVLVAAQMAEQGLADARTEALRTGQSADRERDRIVEEARAAAAERVGEARNRTAAVLAVQSGMSPATRDVVLDRLYRDGVAALLHRAGRLVAVDVSGGARVILPGTVPGGAAPP